MTPNRAVFDASVVLRALVARDDDAQAWLRRAETGEVVAVVPELLYAECAQALVRYVRGRVLDVRAAIERSDFVSALRLDIRPLAPLIAPALGIALERELSAYDACYVALAEAEQAPLVTADRRLAAAVPDAELLA